MRLVQEYRQQAIELRKLAEKERNAHVRESMLGLADTYDALAEQRECFLELQELIRFQASVQKG